jgi:hypothetical protein
VSSVHSVPARLQHSVHGADRGDCAAAQVRLVALAINAVHSWACIRDHSGVEAQNSLVNKLLVGGVPGSRDVEVGLEHAFGRAAGRQAVSLGDESQTETEGVEAFVGETDIHGRHSARRVPVEGIDGLVA